MVKTKEITLMAWNVQDGLSDPARADEIAEKVAEFDPDLAIFSEGAIEGHEVTQSARRLLEKHVGRVYQADYADADDRPDRHRLVAVAKPLLGEPAVVSNFGRNGFYFTPAELPIRIAGLHAYDRDHRDIRLSDDVRRQQIQHVLSRLALGLDDQAIVLGDLEAMHPTDFRARTIRTVAPLLSELPAPQPNEARSVLERIGSVSHRLAQMAMGSPLAELAAARFHPADRHHRPTSAIGPVRVQKDHVLAKRSELSHYQLHEHADVSDHAAVSVQARIFSRRGKTL